MCKKIEMAYDIKSDTTWLTVDGDKLLSYEGDYYDRPVDMAAKFKIIAKYEIKELESIVKALDNYLGNALK